MCICMYYYFIILKETSSFKVERLRNKQYVFITHSYPNHALKFDKTAERVVVGEYHVQNINDISDDFQFKLESPQSICNFFPFVCKKCATCI